MRMNIRTLLISVFTVSIILGCSKDSTGPKKTKGTIQGTAKSNVSGSPAVHPAYVFIADSLVATTDATGGFIIADLEEGAYTLTCSALGFQDLTEQVQVQGGKTAFHDFILQPDTHTGRVTGEFQDLVIFNDSLQTHPEMANWSDQAICDGVTGATMQIKTLHYDVPPRQIFLGDSMLIESDGWGQYSFKIQVGTYSIRATCEGYKDVVHTIHVAPDDRQYFAIFMDRQPLP
jgi:hypothetical protein